MTFTITAWMIPTAICVFLLAWAFLWPLPEAHGDYNFAPVLSAMLRLAIVTVGSLIAWLIYFMVN